MAQRTIGEKNEENSYRNLTIIATASIFKHRFAQFRGPATRKEKRKDESGGNQRMSRAGSRRVEGGLQAAARVRVNLDDEREGEGERGERESPLADYVPNPPSSFTPAIFFLPVPSSFDR